MKISTTAVLISALIFPGGGHFYLKKYVSCSILVISTIIPLYIIITQAVERATLLSEQILRGEVPYEIEAILKLAMQHPTGADAHLLSIATTALIIVWTIGIIDSYRLGHIRDREKEVANNG